MDESVDYIAFTLYTSITIFIALFDFSFVYLIRFPKRSSERELNSAINFCEWCHFGISVLGSINWTTPTKPIKYPSTWTHIQKSLFKTAFQITYQNFYFMATFSCSHLTVSPTFIGGQSLNWSLKNVNYGDDKIAFKVVLNFSYPLTYQPHISKLFSSFTILVHYINF